MIIRHDVHCLFASDFLRTSLDCEVCILYLCSLNLPDAVKEIKGESGILRSEGYFVKESLPISRRRRRHSSSSPDGMQLLLVKPSSFNKNIFSSLL